MIFYEGAERERERERERESIARVAVCADKRGVCTRGLLIYATANRFDAEVQTFRKMHSRLLLEE